MGIKAVAVDIDGTITDLQRRLYWEAVEGLRAVEAQGIPVILATGNVMPVTKTIAAMLGVTGPLVCENGGAVYAADLAWKRILHSRRRGDEAFEYLRGQGMDVKPLWSDAWRESEVAIQLNVHSEEVRRRLDGWGLDVVATRFAIHLMEPGLNKEAGLEVALSQMDGGIRLQDVLAIGDSRNDVEMLRACGASAAVGNAMPEAAAAAQYNATAEHGRGVAEALAHFGLVGRPHSA
jgi:phosphoglycolate phosphatase (TIGR01487 family)